MEKKLLRFRHLLFFIPRQSICHNVPFTHVPDVNRSKNLKTRHNPKLSQRTFLETSNAISLFCEGAFSVDIYIWRINSCVHHKRITQALHVPKIFVKRSSYASMVRVFGTTEKIRIEVFLSQFVGY